MIADPPQTALDRIEAVLYSANPRTAYLSRGALFALAALTAALAVALLGPLYAVAGFAVLIGGLLVLRDIRWGLLALFGVIGLLPFAALPFKIGFRPTFLDVALLAVYFVWVLRVVTRRDRELVGTALGPLIFLFLSLAIFSFANGLRYSRPSATIIRNFAELILAIAFFFVLVNTLRRRADVDFMARLVMLAGAAGAAIAIVLYVIPVAWAIRILDALGRFNYPGGAGALRYIEDSTENPMRAIGTMVDPNVLGGFLIFITAFTLLQLVSARPLFRRMWLAAFAGAEMLALYLTYSRGSMAGLFVGLAVIGLLRYRKLLLLGAAAASLLIFLPQTQAYIVHFIEGVQLQDRATLMRLGEYKDALALIARYPWLGVGFAGSPDADLYVGVSNVYLLMAEIMGVIGLTVFLLVLAGYLRSLWVAWRRNTDPGLEPLFLGLGAAIIGGIVGGVFDHYLFNLVYPHMGVLLWTYLGLGMAAARLVEPSAASSAPTEVVHS